MVDTLLDRPPIEIPHVTVADLERLNPNFRELPKPENNQFDLQSLYINQLEELRRREPSHNKNSWEIIKKFGDYDIENRTHTVERIPQYTLADKLRLQHLSLTAWAKGVGNIQQFKNLVSYLESVMYETNYKTFDYKKGLGEADKEKIIKDLEEKGYDVELNRGFYENETKTEVYGAHYKHFKIETSHIPVLKEMLVGKNDPVEVIRELMKTGFYISDNILRISDSAKDVVSLIQSPYPLETLRYVQRLNRWNPYMHKDYSSNDPPILSYFTELAQIPHPQISLPEQVIDKVRLLANTLNINVDISTFDRLRILAEDEDKIELLSYILKIGLSSSDLHGSLNYLDTLKEAGLVPHLAAIYRCGININDVIASDFENYHGQGKDIRAVKGLMSQDYIKSVLQDPDKQEFFRIWTDVIGKSIPQDKVWEVLNTRKFFDKKELVVYLTKTLIQGNKKLDYAAVSFNLLTTIMYDKTLLTVLTNKDFPNYVTQLREKWGIEPELFQYGETLYPFLPNFSSGTYKKMFEPQTLAFIKSLGEKPELKLASEYIKFSDNPRLLEAARALHSLGLNPNATIDISTIQTINNISETMPNFVDRIMSPQFKIFVNRLREDFGHQVDFFNFPLIKPNLYKLIDNSDKFFNLVKLLDENTGTKINFHYIDSYIKLIDIPDIDKKIISARGVLTAENLNTLQHFRIYTDFEAEANAYKNAIDYFENPDLLVWMINRDKGKQEIENIIKTYSLKDKEKVTTTLLFIKSINGMHVDISPKILESYIKLFGEFPPSDIIDTLNSYNNQRLLNPLSAEDIINLSDFITEFGPLYLPSLFEIYSRLRNNKEVGLQLQNMGITSSGGEGIKQVKEIYRKVTRELVETGRTSLDTKEPLVVDIISSATRFETSAWSNRGYNLVNVIERFDENVASGRIKSAPNEYTPKEIKVRKLVEDKQFSFSTPAIDKFNILRHELKTAAKMETDTESLPKTLLNLRKALFEQKVRLESSLNTLGTSLDKQNITDSVQRQKRLESAERGINQNLQKSNQFEIDLENIQTHDELVVKLSEFGSTITDTSLKDTIIKNLRQLLLLKSIEINPEYGTDPLDIPGSIADGQNLSISAVLRIMEVLQNGVKFEALPTYNFSKNAEKFIEKSVIDTTAFKEEIKRAQQISDGQAEEFKLYPGRNILTELSGYYSDACWTRTPDLTVNNPNIIGVPFVKIINGVPIIQGGTLLIETKLANGENAVVIRGINPRENVIRRLSAEDFFENTTSAIIDWAKARGIKNIVAPAGSSGALSNRPTINAYVSSKYQKRVSLGETINFNGYDITNNCYLVRRIEQT